MHMRHRHTVVWLDHYEAIVMHVHAGGSDTVRINSDRSPEEHQLHRKSGAPGAGHLTDDAAFYAQIAHALHESEVILITGPGLAKSAFVDYLKRRSTAVAARVVAIETVNHPSEGQLRAFAQTFFKRLQNLGAI